VAEAALGQKLLRPSCSHYHQEMVSDVPCARGEGNLRWRGRVPT
jgi:hypothetical protein